LVGVPGSRCYIAPSIFSPVVRRRHGEGAGEKSGNRREQGCRKEGRGSREERGRGREEEAVGKESCRARQACREETCAESGAEACSQGQGRPETGREAGEEGSQGRDEGCEEGRRQSGGEASREAREAGAEAKGRQAGAADSRAGCAGCSRCTQEGRACSGSGEEAGSPRPSACARAEAPSAVAAPPASSDRLIREDDLAHPAVRTVPVRIDVEQGAGRFYVIANPMESTVRVSEGLEWDFRYLGGADVNVEEVVIEFEKPSPFAQNVFRTRKPGGARPHRQLSGGAVPSAVGKRVQYTVRAINQFKMELANTKVYLNVVG
jgi:hypothetical protein